jgi:uncharacterized protein YndB with AHSA1/START domain
MAGGVSQFVAAPPEAVWAAFMDPAALVAWLPPAQMTGAIEDFDGRVGGGYRMTLTYPPDERDFRGKTTEREDRVTVRFVALSPPRLAVEAISFESPEAAFHGEMTMAWTFEPAPGGTRVTVVTENLPPGLRAEDNDEGARISLAQLARRFA